MEDRILKHEVESHPYPLLFATVSGAHLYGFPSADSDYDVRGAHVLPADEVFGLDDSRETVERPGFCGDIELDTVTHDVKKFFTMMLKRNGYVLEQLWSPLVVHTTPEHEELKELAHGCVTCNHGHHYLGFARRQWELFEKESPPRIKPLLYTYRVLLTGIHLMEVGEIEANLVTLNESHGLPYIPELVQRKREGAEKETLSDVDLAFHRAEVERLTRMLETARDETSLPEQPTVRRELSDLLVRIRRTSLGD